MRGRLQAGPRLVFLPSSGRRCHVPTSHVVCVEDTRTSLKICLTCPCSMSSKMVFVTFDDDMLDCSRAAHVAANPDSDTTHLTDRAHPLTPSLHFPAPTQISRHLHTSPAKTKPSPTLASPPHTPPPSDTENLIFTAQVPREI